MRASELPARPSRSVFTIGMAPPTAASKLSATWFFSAIAASATPCRASSALLAVTTDFFAASAAEIAACAGFPLAADQLHEHIDLAIGCQRDRVGNPAQLLVIDVALLAVRARADRHDLDRTTAARGECVALAFDQPGDGRSDRAQAGNTEFQRGRHGSL